MFNSRKTQPKLSALDGEIARLISEMSAMPGDSDEYKKSVDNLKMLYEAKQIESNLEAKPTTVDVNTVITVAGNLIGILAILGFEQAGVITSKGLNFVLKPKI